MAMNDDIGDYNGFVGSVCQLIFFFRGRRNLILFISFIFRSAHFFSRVNNMICKFSSVLREPSLSHEQCMANQNTKAFFYPNIYGSVHLSGIKSGMKQDRSPEINHAKMSSQSRCVSMEFFFFAIVIISFRLII